MSVDIKGETVGAGTSSSTDHGKETRVRDDNMVAENVHYGGPRRALGVAPAIEANANFPIPRQNNSR